MRSGGPWVGGAVAAPPAPQTGVKSVRIENNEFANHPVGRVASALQLCARVFHTKGVIISLMAALSKFYLKFT